MSQLFLIFIGKITIVEEKLKNLIEKIYFFVLFYKKIIFNHFIKKNKKISLYFLY